MAYDPQANHRRPRPSTDDAAPVEALLGQDAAPAAAGSSRDVPAAPDDPPPSPSVTPDPADPPPDSLLINTGVAGALATIVGLVVLRHLWRRHCRSGRGASVADNGPTGSGSAGH